MDNMAIVNSPTLVTINYNSADMVDGLFRSIDIDMQLVVVDNYSTAEARDAISEVSVRHGAALILGENDGFAGGLNRANMEIGVESGLLLVNPDVTFRQGAIECLLQDAASSGSDLLSPSIVVAGTDATWFRGGSISATLEVTHKGFGRKLTPRNGFELTEFISGCVVLFSPRARAGVLPLDPSLFLYYEDVLMSLNARRLGLTVGVSHGAIAEHAEGGTSNGGYSGRSVLYYYYQSRNRLIAARRIGRGVHWIALLGTPYVLSKTFYRLHRSEDQSRGEKFRAVLKGVFDGLRGKDGKR
ncbi:glycosyltransferase family 2 protein [Rhodococcus opacus]|nr:glycosyltransferase family 2 protein [Rhodococcus opacus]